MALQHHQQCHFYNPSHSVAYICPFRTWIWELRPHAHIKRRENFCKNYEKNGVILGWNVVFWVITLRTGENYPNMAKNPSVIFQLKIDTLQKMWVGQILKISKIIIFHQHLSQLFKFYWKQVLSGIHQCFLYFWKVKRGHVAQNSESVQLQLSRSTEFVFSLVKSLYLPEVF